MEWTKEEFIQYMNENKITDLDKENFTISKLLNDINFVEEVEQTMENPNRQYWESSLSQEDFDKFKDHFKDLFKQE
jgi:hypothetical protein